MVEVNASTEFSSAIFWALLGEKEKPSVSIFESPVATAVADLLEDICAIDPNHRVEIELNCRTLPDRLSANVIASSVGSQYPEKIIDFGGHFDSWDEGEGAHDDGAGCMHAFEALRLLKALGYTPRHTLRCVFWINEENGLRGGTEYARLAAERGENHIAALESDRGGFVPRGFGVDSAIMPGVKMYQKLIVLKHLIM